MISYRTSALKEGIHSARISVVLKHEHGIMFRGIAVNRSVLCEIVSGV